jgi:phage terminase large subunit-like protein
MSNPYIDNIREIKPIFIAELQNTQTTFDTYIAAKTNVQPLIDQNLEIEGDLRDLQHRLNELNQLDDTYTQTYLDFKANPPKKSFFSGLGLRTTQDWAIAIFYFSYLIFSAIILMYAFVNSVQKIYAFFFVFTLLSVFLLISTTMLMYYG